ncbi:M56 family metallopeptidase [Kitasatospora sp. CM 4170]|uniref:M56 family metallopeptidase n=1 Tax=Kitasatospora aburaviensis TaxID=67265 RepID=A0ABW1EP74_9ACTN|nr:M56 family metallopeptidase [Kitasatospora sp. CM 4170]WNM48805.1 M56 family metallopeptidase [Kitasatospora sp. CM 4170]
MTALLGLLLLGLLLSTVAPRLLARADWAGREPVLALLAWQCLVVAVMLCCALSLLLAASAALPGLRDLVFAGAPHGVEEAYGLQGGEGWGRLYAAVLAAGGVQTVLALTREVRSAKALRNHRHAQLADRAPELPESIDTVRHRRERLVVLENVRPEAWSLPGHNSRLVVTTGALQQLTDRELAAVLSHERGHVRARHHWLSQCSQALASGFPGVGVFSAFRDQVGELVELAADDRAARRHGRHTTALALAELNLGRGVFGSCPPGQAQSPKRVDRLLAGRPRLPVLHRLQLTVAALAAPAAVVLVATAPGLSALI